MIRSSWLKSVESTPPPHVNAKDLWTMLSVMDAPNREKMLQGLLDDQQSAYQVSSNFNTLGNMIVPVVVAAGGRIVVQPADMPKKPTVLEAGWDGDNFIMAVDTL